VAGLASCLEAELFQDTPRRVVVSFAHSYDGSVGEPTCKEFEKSPSGFLRIARSLKCSANPVSNLNLSGIGKSGTHYTDELIAFAKPDPEKAIDAASSAFDQFASVRKGERALQKLDGARDGGIVGEISQRRRIFWL
jgi:hypothetical protein